MDFHGEFCPYCSTELLENDDIVVCPECGTPYHRDCYLAADRCIHEAEHGSFEWKPAGDSRPDEEQVHCPACKAINPKEADFCARCGSRLSGPAPVQRGPFGIMPTAVTPPDQDDEDFEKSFDRELYGIPLADWKTYVGHNYHYYLFHLNRQQQTGSKLAATVSAAIIPAVYFMYRKIWWAAGISLVANILFNIPGAVITANEIGMGLWSPFGLDLAAWETLHTISSMLSFAYAMLCGGFAVYLFRKNAVKKINQLHDKYPDPFEYRNQLERQGGPSRVALYVVAGLYMLSIFFIIMSGGIGMLI